MTKYLLILPHEASRIKFIVVLLVALFGSALIAGLDGKPEHPDVATEEERSPTPPDSAG